MPASRICPTTPVTNRSWVAAWVFAVTFFLCMGLLPATGQTTATVSVNTGWNGWLKPDGTPYIPDEPVDQQTGQASSDFVGTSALPGFAIKAGTLSGTGAADYMFWRTRMDTYNSQGFKNYIVVGMDLNIATEIANGLTPSIDLFLIMEAPNNGGDSTISFAGPGTGLNTGPSTTTIGTRTNFTTLVTGGASATYEYRLAETYLGPGGTQDAYVSFGMSFAALSTAISAVVGYTYVFDINSVISYVAGTSTQANSLNQDLYGISGSGNGGTWWDQGGMSYPMTPDGRIPEPATYAQIGLLLFAGGLIAYRRRRREAKASPVPLHR